MAGLKFERKLGEAWIFDLTLLDRTGAAQSLAGLTLNARLRSFDKATTIWTETAGGGFTSLEVGASTTGYFTYSRESADSFTGVVVGGVYRLDFLATVNGEPIYFPEANDIVIEVVG